LAGEATPREGRDMSHLRFGEIASDEYPLLEQPAGQPTYGENHAFRVFDEGERFTFSARL